jgi:hypothetical protein
LLYRRKLHTFIRFYFFISNKNAMRQDVWDPIIIIILVSPFEVPVFCSLLFGAWFCFLFFNNTINRIIPATTIAPNIPPDSQIDSSNSRQKTFPRVESIWCWSLMPKAIEFLKLSSIN